MDNILQGIPGVIVYLDDILITGSTPHDHLQSLETVLDGLTKAGLHIKKDKCTFMSSSVTYLGDSEGLHPLPSKVRAVTEAPCPINPKQLKAYLGLLTYYSQVLAELILTAIIAVQATSERHYLAVWSGTAEYIRKVKNSAHFFRFTCSL